MRGGETPENINPADLLPENTKKILEGLAEQTKEIMTTGSDDPEAVLKTLLQRFPELTKSEINQEYLKSYLENNSRIN